jgi:Bacterial Ig-like domain (group 2)
MNRVYRSLLLTGIVAVGLAGCGDDVTVTEPPPPPPPGITSVTVTPDNVAVNPGQTIQMTANVTAEAGATYTVTWQSSDATRASVSSSGLVTIAANAPAGPVSIQATATTSDGAASAGAATLNVVPANANTPQVSIGAVNKGGVPANLAAATGQLDVVVNLERNNTVVQELQLIVDTETGDSVVSSQTFATPVAQAGPSEAPEAITLSFNSANFACTATACNPSFLNRQHAIKAKVTYGGSGASNASNSVQVTLANANAFTGSVTMTGTVATALDAAGRKWDRGGLDVSVLPIVYTPNLTVSAGTVSFGGGCDASGTGTRSKSLTANGAAFTASFAQTATGGPSGSNVMSYEFNSAACAAGFPNGETIAVTAVGSNGNNLTLAATGLTGIRLDNRAPGVPTFVANPNVRQNGWLNAAVDLAGVNSGTNPDGWLANGTADAGVGGYARTIRVGDATGGLVDDAIAQAGSSTPTLPAPTATNITKCAVISATDLLGNESALPAAGAACTVPPAASATAVAAQSLEFGVDIAAPTIAFSGGLASNARLNGGAVGAEFQVTVTDTGTVGNSGMLSGSAVVGTVQIRNAAGTTCFVGTVVAGVCTAVSVNAAPGFPLVPTTTVAANATTGYYSYSGASQDAAGNMSAPVTRVIAFDPAANVPALTQALFNTPLNGPSVVFNANASDNFDLWKVTYTLTYGGGLAGPLVYPAVTLNTFNGTPLVNTNVPAGITVNGFVRQIENVTGNAPLAVGGQFLPTQLSGVALDQANNPSAAANTGINAAAVTAGVSYLTAAAAQLIDSWSITAPSAATNISDNAGPAAPVNPLSVTLTASVAGPTATFNPPFSRVDFYALVGGNLVQIGSATTVSTVDDGSANGRVHSYSISWTPGTSAGLGAVSLFAVGVSAAGDGLVTLVNGNVTITNP